MLIAEDAPLTLEISTLLSLDSVADAEDTPPNARSAPPSVKFAAELSVKVPRLVLPLPSGWGDTGGGYPQW